MFFGNDFKKTVIFRELKSEGSMENEQKMQFGFGISGNHNLSFLFLEKYKKIINIDFLSFQFPHFTIFKLFFFKFNQN